MDEDRLRTLARWRRLSVVAVIAGPAALVALSASCTISENTPLSLGDDRVDASSPSFSNGAETDAGDGGHVPLEYCPSTSCPPSLTTCASSRFACSVDLQTDVRNCGSCGFACYSNSALDPACIEGKCVLRCTAGNADCNGIVDDDCETKLGSNENCNGCGDKCLDPAKPCVFDVLAKTGQCGCKPGFEYCSGRCVALDTNDSHCGACGVACSATGDGGPAGANAYYGCANAECGHLKCRSGYANCDGDAENGCEASLLSNDSCGACGKVCSPGQTCIFNRSGEYECACAPGKVLCGTECVDPLTDPRHCGGCDMSCLTTAPDSTGIAFCSYGSCEYGCAEGRGDCNGDTKDGCETDLAFDPENCGACGLTCDLASGQPCVRGRCAVEICDGGVGPQ